MFHGHKKCPIFRCRHTIIHRSFLCKNCRLYTMPQREKLCVCSLTSECGVVVRHHWNSMKRHALSASWRTPATCRFCARKEVTHPTYMLWYYLMPLHYGVGLLAYKSERSIAKEIPLNKVWKRYKCVTTNEIEHMPSGIQYLKVRSFKGTGI